MWSAHISRCGPGRREGPTVAAEPLHSTELPSLHLTISTTHQQQENMGSPETHKDTSTEQSTYL